MARRLPAYRPDVKMFNISGKALQWIGFVLVCLSSFSVAILQRGILHLDEDGALEAVSEAMKPGGEAMGWATAAVFCSLAATLAIPVFCKLLYEGWKHTEDEKGLLLRLVLCAVISEIPYDLAMSGKIFDWSTQNPVWGLLLAAVILTVTRRWRMKTTATNCTFRAVIVVAALSWALLLRVYMGALLILLPVLFCFAAQWKWITMLGGILITLVQFPAPLGMLFIHWYDEKQDYCSKILPYCLYPIQLFLFGAIGHFV